MPLLKENRVLLLKKSMLFLEECVLCYFSRSTSKGISYATSKGMCAILFLKEDRVQLLMLLLEECALCYFEEDHVLILATSRGGSQDRALLL